MRVNECVTVSESGRGREGEAGKEREGGEGEGERERLRLERRQIHEAFQHAASPGIFVLAFFLGLVSGRSSSLPPAGRASVQPRPRPEERQRRAFLQAASLLIINPVIHQ